MATTPFRESCLAAIVTHGGPGALPVSALRRLLQEKTLIRSTALIFGLSLTATAFCRDPWICLPLALCIGAYSLMPSAVIDTVLQARVEREMRGRVVSLHVLVFQGIYPCWACSWPVSRTRHPFPWRSWWVGVYARRPVWR